MRLLKDRPKDIKKGESVVYWMRLEDLRCQLLPPLCNIRADSMGTVEDNTAFARAGEKAKELKIPLIVLFVLSPGDYKWHDRSGMKIDFTLRNLKWLKVRHL